MSHSFATKAVNEQKALDFLRSFRATPEAERDYAIDKRLRDSAWVDQTIRLLEAKLEECGATLYVSIGNRAAAPRNREERRAHEKAGLTRVCRLNKHHDGRCSPDRAEEIKPDAGDE